MFVQRLIVLLLFFTFSVTSAQNEQDKIEWREDHPLEWKYFRGEPDMASSFYAETSSGISQSFSVKKSGRSIEFSFDIKSFFNPDLSWVKEGEQSAYLLAHEQLHFDITELHARKLRKALSEYKIDENYEIDLQQISRKIQSQSDRMQNRFDAETNHSLNKEAEMKWRDFVENEMQKLEDYSF